MFKLQNLLLLFALVAVIYAADVQGPPELLPKPNSTTTTSSTTTTTTQKTTSKTTTTPITTTSTTTPSTTKTTVTTPPTTPTTTAAPINPTPGQWHVNYPNTNNSCIIVKLAMKIQYAVNNTIKLNLTLPKNANATGTCDKTNQEITLNWDKNDVKLNFKQLKDDKFALSEIDVNFYDSEKNVTVALHRVKDDFVTHDDKSYKCDKQQSLNLTNTNNNDIAGFVLISDVQLQAFANTTKEIFNEAIDCETSQTSDVVPIAVGCALVALIILVLVVYLIGRRRSQARGYLSMFTSTRREEDYIPMKNLSCFN